MTSRSIDVAVVTGVSSGIGLATLRRLLGLGKLVVGIARNEGKLAALRRELGPNFSPLCHDLASASERAECTRALEQIEGTVTLFVSNAGDCAYESPLELSGESLRRLFELNVHAPIELCQALTPRMPKGGHVVQISSVAARFLPNARYGPYSSSKVAIEQLVEALRLELHPRGIKVSLVVPGLVDTPIYDKVPGFAETRAKLAQQIGAWLEPDDVADAIAWLVARPAHVAVTELTLMPALQTR